MYDLKYNYNNYTIILLPMKFNPTKCFTMTLASRKLTQNLYTFRTKLSRKLTTHYSGREVNCDISHLHVCSEKNP